MSDDLSLFLARFDALPQGYGEGAFRGRRYGVTVRASPDGRRGWLFGEELGGADRVSCNLYRFAGGGARLLPCEMPAEKVVAFVVGFRPDEGADGSRSPPRRRGGG